MQALGRGHASPRWGGCRQSRRARLEGREGHALPVRRVAAAAARERRPPDRLSGVPVPRSRSNRCGRAACAEIERSRMGADVSLDGRGRGRGQDSTGLGEAPSAGGVVRLGGLRLRRYQRRQGSPSADRSSSRGTAWSSGAQASWSVSSASTPSSSVHSATSAGLSAWRRSQARRLRQAAQRVLSGQIRRPPDLGDRSSGARYQEHRPAPDDHLVVAPRLAAGLHQVGERADLPGCAPVRYCVTRR